MSDIENNFPSGSAPEPGGDSSSAAAPEEVVPPGAVHSMAALPAPGAPVPEDLRTGWSWPDLILFLVYVLGSSIVLPALAVLMAFIGWKVKPTDLEKVPAMKAIVLIAGQALWSVLTIVYLFFAVRLRQTGSFWHGVGWRPLRPEARTPGSAILRLVLGGGILAIGVQIASAALGKRAKLPIEELFQNRLSIMLLMLLGVLVAPVVEETIFRGYIYPVVARGFGIPAGIVFTGALFGMAHALQLWGGWGQIVLLVLVGMVLTYVRARTGTVLASYLVHLSYNSMLFLQLLIVTRGLRHFPPPGT